MADLRSEQILRIRARFSEDSPDPKGLIEHAVEDEAVLLRALDDAQGEIKRLQIVTAEAHAAGVAQEREAIAKEFDERAKELTRRATWTEANCTDYPPDMLFGVIERIENDVAQCRQDAALIRARSAVK